MSTGPQGAADGPHDRLIARAGTRSCSAQPDTSVVDSVHLAWQVACRVEQPRARIWVPLSSTADSSCRSSRSGPRLSGWQAGAGARGPACCSRLSVLSNPEPRRVLRQSAADAAGMPRRPVNSRREVGAGATAVIEMQHHFRASAANATGPELLAPTQSVSRKVHQSLEVDQVTSVAARRRRLPPPEPVAERAFAGV